MTSSKDALKQVSENIGLHLSASELDDYHSNLEGALSAWATLDDAPLGEVQHRTCNITIPKPEDNKHNAWACRCEIKGAAGGKLAGKTVAIKDNILMDGVLMRNGGVLFGDVGFVPDMDATVVTRVLEAGGTIIGKTHVEDLCMSGGSHTNHYGHVLNPNDVRYHSGGSSSGSAVVVALGEADMALGGDQGGSIRIPSSWCGTYGMKPTFGLVPHTGILGLEPTIDHVGPITRNVHDNALMLEVLAGADGYDDRQNIPEAINTKYTARLKQGIKGLRIGVVKEGFEHSDADKPAGKLVNQQVLKAVDVFKHLGASVSDVSVPLHKSAGVCTP